MNSSWKPLMLCEACLMMLQDIVEWFIHEAGIVICWHVAFICNAACDNEYLLVQVGILQSVLEAPKIVRVSCRPSPKLLTLFGLQSKTTCCFPQAHLATRRPIPAEVIAISREVVSAGDMSHVKTLQILGMVEVLTIRNCLVRTIWTQDPCRRGGWAR